MQLKIAGILAVIFTVFSGQHANALPSEIHWNGTCYDCVFDSETESLVNSPASAVFTTDGTNFLTFSYSSALFEFTAINENLSFQIFNLADPLPGAGDVFVSGTGDFSVFFGEGVEGTVEAGFIFATRSNPLNETLFQIEFANVDWALCVNPGNNSDGACLLLSENTEDFGTSSTFSTTNVSEPSALAIIGLGLMGLAAIRRRRIA